MNKTLLTTGMLLGLTAATAFGQNAGITGAAAIAEQSRDVKSGQKPNQDLKQEMAGMMKQMNEAMLKMTSLMETKMENRNKQDIGKMMRELSIQMNDMAGLVVQSRIDPQTMNKMHARMESVNQRIDAIQ